MMAEPFASDPFVVGKSAPSPAAVHIPAEESLAPIVSHEWVNSEYMHMVVDASPKALAVKPGQCFNLLCPSPDVGEVIPVLDSDGTSAVENVERILRDLIAKRRADAFYTCGSNRLMELMKRLGKEQGIPGQIAMEQVMACGLGPCYVCVRTFEVNGHKELRRVCIDGPVFDLQEALGW